MAGTNSSSDDDYYKEALHINDTINSVFISLCMPIILLGNGLVIVSVAKFRKLQTVMNIFVANLAVADLLVGFPAIPLYILFYVNDKVRLMKYPCLLKYVFVLVGLPTSALNLLLVTIDRFIAIVYPFQYQYSMTKSRAKIMIAMIWVYALSTATMPLYGVNTWEPGIQCDFWLVLPSALVIPCVPMMQAIALGTTFVLYLKIFHVARMSKKRVSKYKSKGEINEKKMKRDTKNAQVMAIVFCMFLVFWMPLFTSGVLKYTGLPGAIVDMIKAGGVSLAFANSVINPIIYCWIRPDFRVAFMKLTCFRVPMEALQSLTRSNPQEEKQEEKLSSTSTNMTDGDNNAVDFDF